jgi:hypothetical protein
VKFKQDLTIAMDMENTKKENVNVKLDGPGMIVIPQNV